MTGIDIIKGFKIYYDRVASYSAPGYRDEQILLFLNNAQNKFIEDAVFGKNFQPPAFEDNEKRVADIFSLVDASEITSGISSSSLYGNSWILPEGSIASGNMLYPIRVDARVTRTNPSVTAQYIRCDRIHSINVGRFVTSDINRAHFINPKYVQEEGGIVFIGDYYTTGIDRCKIQYVKKPYPITISMSDYNGTYSDLYMNLPSHTHQSIIYLAVRDALQVINDPRWETAAQEYNIKGG